MSYAQHTQPATQPAPSDAPAPSISEYELCVRWNKCPRSLLNWRKEGKVPKFYRIGKVIRYPLAGVQEFEANDRGEPLIKSQQ